MSIAAFAIRRVLWAVPLLLLVTLGAFAALRGAGGDPFELPEGYAVLPPPLQAELREHYNLDEPWFVEFATYVRNAATLNFGPSLSNRYVSVDQVVQESLPVTAALVALASLVAIPFGVALGLLGALRRRSTVDTASTALASLMLVVPVFVVAWLLARYPGVRWHWFPLGWDSWSARIVPVLVLALAPTGYIARLVRATVVETLEQDHVRTARAKGLRPPRIVVVHVLRNSVVPVLSAAVPMLALLITGAFFVEAYFGIPGASGAFAEAARTRDFPLLLGLTVVLAAVVIVVNLAADVLIAILDPRVRERP